MSVLALVCGTGDATETARFVTGLCEHPDRMAEHLEATDIVVLVLHKDRYSLAAIQTELRKIGLDPLGVPIVHAGENPPDRLKTLISSATAWARTYPGSRPENSKPRFPRQMSRRSFLSMPSPEYVAVPFINKEVCAAPDGCRACVVACPQTAYRASGGTIDFTREACVSCGICVSACPAGAIDNPVVSAEQLEAQVTALVGAVADPIGVAFICHEGSVELPQDWYPVEVPCTGMVTAGWMVAPLVLGAGAVAVVPCSGSRCSLGNDSRVAGAFRFGRALLAELEIDQNRLQAAPGGVSEPLSGIRFGLNPFGPGTLPSVIAALMPQGTFSLDHPAAEVGVVSIDPKLCTMCGRCGQGCPTGALLVEGSGDTTGLTFDGSLCTACGQCLVQCPEEHAIEVARRVSSDALGAGRVTLHETVAAICERCGAAIAPVAMLDRISALLGEENQAVMSVVSRRCVNCRGIS